MIEKVEYMLRFLPSWKEAAQLFDRKSKYIFRCVLLEDGS